MTANLSRLVPPLEFGGRPLSQQWISDELMQETMRVWSKAYGRPITQEEAIEILTNVKQYADVLYRAELEMRRK